MATGSLDFNDIVDDVVDRAGGQEATAADIRKVRVSLRLLTERWMAQGYNTWRLETKTFTTSNVTPIIQLDECVDDVIQVTSERPGLSEMPMMRISPVQYAQITKKNSQGQPSQYYLDRKECPKLFIFPIGTPGMNFTLTVYYIARPEDYKRYGDTTDDVPGRWLEALVKGLAADLAAKRPPYNEQLIARLKGEAAEAEDLAQRADRGRQRYRYRIGGL